MSGAGASNIAGWDEQRRERTEDGLGGRSSGRRRERGHCILPSGTRANLRMRCCGHGRGRGGESRGEGEAKSRTCTHLQEEEEEDKHSSFVLDCR